MVKPGPAPHESTSFTEGKVYFDTEQDRTDLLACYKKWFWKKFNEDAKFHKVAMHLKDHRIDRLCKPKACRRDVISDYLAWLNSPKGQGWLAPNETWTALRRGVCQHPHDVVPACAERSHSVTWKVFIGQETHVR